MGDSASHQHGPQHEVRVLAFKRDLAKGDLTDVIRRHITTGAPVVIDADTYYDLRRRVAREYGIHPTAVILVGSCRLGFSLKEKNKVRYEPVRPDSDVDVAVVAPTLFEDLWDNVFNLVHADRSWALARGKGFARDLFCGWITPQNLPPEPRFHSAKDWAEFFDRIAQERLCGMRRVSARLYRTWDRLEKYQEIMVRECQRDLVLRGAHERIEPAGR